MSDQSQSDQGRNPEKDETDVDPATGPAGDVPEEQDPLAQVEDILNNAEVPADESVAQGAGQVDAAELKNDLLRLQAEYVNYRKRVERDRAVAGESAVIGVLNSLLPVLDDVDAARTHGDLTEGPFAAIAAKLEAALKTYGLERIDEIGVEFDPNVHEAISQEPSNEHESGQIIAVVQNGYMLGERVIRPALVRVAQ